MTGGFGIRADPGRACADVPVVRSAQLRLSGQRLPLVGSARIYVCGITPYDVTHLGHAATFIWSDVVACVLRAAGIAVTTCRNVTDVDDVLTAAAGSRGRAYDEFALHQEYLFDKDMAALRVHSPAYEPRARHHVRQVQQLAAALLDTGHAYERDGFVYFRGAAVVDRSGLTSQGALALSASCGDDPDDARRDDPFDMPVWRPSAGGEPAWSSPWGWGRPGWHAECTAMAVSVLGAAVDILAGGADLAFPHHAYQSAMAEAVTGVAPFARAALHVGAVRHDGVKMARSSGNLVRITDLLRGHQPAAVRLLVVNRPWGAAWEYRSADLERAAVELDELYAAAARPDSTRAATGEVVAALLDDLDVPRAVSIAREEGGTAARWLLRVLALL